MGAVVTKLALVTPFGLSTAAELPFIPQPPACTPASTNIFANPNSGDIIRFRAWGNWVLNNPNPQATAQFRLYFQNAPPAVPPWANLIADTGARVVMPPNRNQITFEWHFYADITFKTGGASGSMTCDAWFQYQDLTLGVQPSLVMAGNVNLNPINLTANNQLVFTLATIPGMVQVNLNQCYIEYLNTP